uniref:Putative secreted protein n=1 Tax=Ixodes ricinus TaxID=34613 RepID=A0A0K8RM54_IXORI
MRVVIAALLSASFIFCTSAAVKKQKKTTPDAIVTVGYMLYGFEERDFEWESQFNSSLEEIHKKAEHWLRREIFMRLKLQTWNITQVDNGLSSKLDSLRIRDKPDDLVDPFKALQYVRQSAEVISNRPDIICLVTKKPLTFYKTGFGLYHPLCEVVVPLILTYNSTNIEETATRLGFLIRNTMNIDNYHTWYNVPKEEKKRRFNNCQVQRGLQKQKRWYL